MKSSVDSRERFLEKARRLRPVHRRPVGTNTGPWHFVQEAHAPAVSVLGAPFLLAFLYLAFSRLPDYALARLYLPLVSGSIAVALALLSGALQRTARSSVGLLLMGFTAWLILCIPLSYWKGGSFGLVLESWSKSLCTFFMIVGLCHTLRQCRYAMYSIGFAVVTIVAACFYFRAFSTSDRLALPQGMLKNPNDLAMILLICLPFWLLIASKKSTVPFRRVLAAVWVLPILFIVLHTGSRSALISLGTVSLIIFRNLNLRYRILLVGCGVGLAAIALASLPESIVDRLSVIMADESRMYDASEFEAASSSEQRLALFKDSIRLTFEHPIFGVGPGQFASYSAYLAGEEGKRALWRETHCSYTEVSSEAGIPALVCYVAVILLCLKKTSSIYRSARGKPQLDEICKMAYCLFLALVAYSTSALFISTAYEMFLPMLAGLTVALENAIKTKVNLIEPTGGGAFQMTAEGDASTLLGSSKTGLGRRG